MPERFAWSCVVNNRNCNAILETKQKYRAWPHHYRYEAETTGSHLLFLVLRGGVSTRSIKTLRGKSENSSDKVDQACPSFRSLHTETKDGIYLGNAKKSSKLIVDASWQAFINRLSKKGKVFVMFSKLSTASCSDNILDRLGL